MSIKPLNTSPLFFFSALKVILVITVYSNNVKKTGLNLLNSTITNVSLPFKSEVTIHVRSLWIQKLPTASFILGLKSSEHTIWEVSVLSKYIDLRFLFYKWFGKYHPECWYWDMPASRYTSWGILPSCYLVAKTNRT
jgi:hypothetical protein